MRRKKRRPEVSEPESWRRQRARKESLYRDGYVTGWQTVHKDYDDPEANLILSLVESSSETHAPALDIDLPCELVPSHTKGHFHLFIDKPMPWENYCLLLDVLAQVGIIEKDYAAVSKQNGYSALSAPGVLKYELELAANSTQQWLNELERGKEC